MRTPPSFFATLRSTDFQFEEWRFKQSPAGISWFEDYDSFNVALAGGLQT